MLKSYTYSNLDKLVLGRREFLMARSVHSLMLKDMWKELKPTAKAFVNFPDENLVKPLLEAYQYNWANLSRGDNYVMERLLKPAGYRYLSGVNAANFVDRVKNIARSKSGIGKKF